MPCVLRLNETDEQDLKNTNKMFLFSVTKIPPLILQLLAMCCIVNGQSSTQQNYN